MKNVLVYVIMMLANVAYAGNPDAPLDLELKRVPEKTTLSQQAAARNVAVREVKDWSDEPRLRQRFSLTAFCVSRHSTAGKVTMPNETNACLGLSYYADDTVISGRPFVEGRYLWRDHDAKLLALGMKWTCKEGRTLDLYCGGKVAHISDSTGKGSGFVPFLGLGKGRHAIIVERYGKRTLVVSYQLGF